MICYTVHIYHMDTLHDILHSIIAHFIPHEGNDYRPHLLQKAAFLGLVGMVVLTFTLANFQALLWQSSDWLVGAVLPAVAFDRGDRRNASGQAGRMQEREAGAGEVLHAEKHPQFLSGRRENQ